jgi:hypothetical protein
MAADNTRKTSNVIHDLAEVKQDVSNNSQNIQNNTDAIGNISIPSVGDGGINLEAGDGLTLSAGSENATANQDSDTTFKIEANLTYLKENLNIPTGGVSKIIAGDNVTISPENGTGNVTINAAGSGSGGIEEAPIDGKQYGREDGEWTEVTSSTPVVPGDGNITLKSTDNTVSITGQNATANQTTDTAWDLSVNIPTPATPGDGKIDLSGGTGINVTGANATANQSGNTAWSVAIDDTVALKSDIPTIPDIPSVPANIVETLNNLSGNLTLESSDDKIVVAEDGTDKINLTLNASLSDLSDVSNQTPADDQILTWNDGTKKWEPAASQSGGVTTLAALDDTNVSTPTEGQTLVWNNTDSKWENADASGGVSNLPISSTDGTVVVAGDASVFEVAVDGARRIQAYEEVRLYGENRVDCFVDNNSVFYCIEGKAVATKQFIAGGAGGLTAASPPYAFAGANDTGLFVATPAGVVDLRVSVNGAEKAIFSNDAFIVSNQIQTNTITSKDAANPSGGVTGDATINLGSHITVNANAGGTDEELVAVFSSYYSQSQRGLQIKNGINANRANAHVVLDAKSDGDLGLITIQTDGNDALTIGKTTNGEPVDIAAFAGYVPQTDDSLVTKGWVTANGGGTGTLPISSLDGTVIVDGDASVFTVSTGGTAAFSLDANKYGRFTNHVGIASPAYSTAALALQSTINSANASGVFGIYQKNTFTCAADAAHANHAKVFSNHLAPADGNPFTTFMQFAGDCACGADVEQNFGLFVRAQGAKNNIGVCVSDGNKVADGDWAFYDSTGYPSQFKGQIQTNTITTKDATSGDPADGKKDGDKVIRLKGNQVQITDQDHDPGTGGYSLDIRDNRGMFRLRNDDVVNGINDTATIALDVNSNAYNSSIEFRTGNVMRAEIVKQSTAGNQYWAQYCVNGSASGLEFRTAFGAVTEKTFETKSDATIISTFNQNNDPDSDNFRGLENYVDRLTITDDDININVDESVEFGCSDPTQEASPKVWFKGYVKDGVNDSDKPTTVRHGYMQGYLAPEAVSKGQFQSSIGIWTQLGSPPYNRTSADLEITYDGDVQANNGDFIARSLRATQAIFVVTDSSTCAVFESTTQSAQVKCISSSGTTWHGIANGKWAVDYYPTGTTTYTEGLRLDLDNGRVTSKGGIGTDTITTKNGASNEVEMLLGTELQVKVGTSKEYGLRVRSDGNVAVGGAGGGTSRFSIQGSVGGDAVYGANVIPDFSHVGSISTATVFQASPSFSSDTTQAYLYANAKLTTTNKVQKLTAFNFTIDYNDPNAKEATDENRAFFTNLRKADGKDNWSFYASGNAPSYFAGDVRNPAGDSPQNEDSLVTKKYTDSRIWKGTQSEYNALSSYDDDILYCITG